MRPVDGVGEVRRIKGAYEWSGTPAVRFEPPEGVSAAMAGTVIDASADPNDIGAMMIDLSVRGWYRIDPDDVHEWVFSASAQRPSDSLTPGEARFLELVLPHRGARTTIAQVKVRLRHHLRHIVDDMCREVVERGWFERDPRHRGFLGAGRAVRTADGTAARIQAMGFKKFIATADAKQIRYEEAAGIFNRYLPYAMAFGLADRWASVIGEVARQARLDGFGNIMGDVVSDPFFWMFYGDDLVFLGAEALTGLGGLVTDLDFEALGGGLGAVFDAVGDVFDF